MNSNRDKHEYDLFGSSRKTQGQGQMLRDEHLHQDMNRMNISNRDDDRMQCEKCGSMIDRLHNRYRHDDMYDHRNDRENDRYAFSSPRMTDDRRMQGRYQYNDDNIRDSYRGDDRSDWEKMKDTVKGDNRRDSGSDRMQGRMRDDENYGRDTYRGEDKSTWEKMKDTVKGDNRKDYGSDRMQGRMRDDDNYGRDTYRGEDKSTWEKMKDTVKGATTSNKVLSIWSGLKTRIMTP